MNTIRATFENMLQSNRTYVPATNREPMRYRGVPCVRGIDGAELEVRNRGKGHARVVQTVRLSLVL